MNRLKRVLLAGFLMGIGCFAFADYPSFGQLIDMTPSPDVADEGINKSLTQQISAGANDIDTGPSHFDSISAEVVATGLPGAGAIAQIGAFHRGSPIHDKPAFADFTQPGRVLDGKRLLVASTSNFGAPLARPSEAPGSIVSLDVSNGPVEVPPAFAAAGGQASALGGAVQVYTAQSPAFVNGVNNPGAVTSDLPAVSLPRSISLNNGHGRPWFANVPISSEGYGTITVLDPNGVPLAGAPDPLAGGVFAGDLTNRNAASTHGIVAGALGTAIITKSPDGSGRAVFAAALADGSVVQVHVQKGVDGLAPPGTFTPIPGVSKGSAESTDPGVVTRVGIAFNWVPTRILYVSDPLADRILALDLSDDQVMFSATNVRYLAAPELNVPIDIAPSIPEVAADNFASNTTLGGGADLYILNRGNNTIVRMSQEGKVLAVRAIEADLPGFRVNGLAVSPDGQTLWVTAVTPNGGAVLRVPAFGAGPLMPGLIADASAAGAKTVQELGAHFFSLDFAPSKGLGPLFNGASCDSCHNDPFPGGMGTTPNAFEFRVGRMINGQFDDLIPNGGPLARALSISALGVACGLPTGVPPDATMTSLRSTMTLRGTALIDDIAEKDILAVQAAQPNAMRGRPNRLGDGRIGKFGWKANTATLVEFIGSAFRDEQGLTNPLFPRDLIDGCGAHQIKPELDAVPLTTVDAFLNTIDPPAPTAACLSSPGAAQFAAVGCAACHTPSMPGPGRSVQLYSDLMLHDMGPGLADGFVQDSATGSEWRTMPLWRVSDRKHFLHDGRAKSLVEAIHAHGGQAAESVQAFDALDPTERQTLLDFLGCI